MERCTTGLDVGAEKGEYIVREYYEVDEHASDKILLQQGEKRDESMEVESTNVDGESVNELPEMTSYNAPVLLRSKQNKISQRSEKSVSVMIEPTSSSRNNVRGNKSRTSMYELGTRGWIFDKSNNDMKKTLKLDGEINAMLNNGISSVDVKLGGIKLTF